MAIVGVGALALLVRPGEVQVRLARKEIEPMAEGLLIAADKGVNVVAGQIAEANEQLENLDVALGRVARRTAPPPRPTTGSRDQRELRVWVSSIASMPAAIDRTTSRSKRNAMGEGEERRCTAWHTRTAKLFFFLQPSRSPVRRDRPAAGLQLGAAAARSRQQVLRLGCSVFDAGGGCEEKSVRMRSRMAAVPRQSFSAAQSRSILRHL